MVQLWLYSGGGSPTVTIPPPAGGRTAPMSLRDGTLVRGLINRRNPKFAICSNWQGDAECQWLGTGSLLVRVSIAAVIVASVQQQRGTVAERYGLCCATASPLPGE